MNKISLLFLFGISTLLITSCGRNFPPNVDARANVFKQLSIANNGEIDSLVKKVEKFQEIIDKNKPLKILRTSDEIEILTSIINASIEGDINVDSLGMSIENTIFLKSRDNTNYVNFKIEDSIFVSEGYQALYKEKIDAYGVSDASKMWRLASNNYISEEMYSYMDSVTEAEKKAIELRYNENIKIFKNLKYLILEEDAILIPPLIDTENKGFISGYILTYLYAFDINTLEKVGQQMIISSNSDEISYMSFSDNLSQYQDAAIETQLAQDLISQKTKKVDSIFIKDYSNL